VPEDPAAPRPAHAGARLEAKIDHLAGDVRDLSESVNESLRNQAVADSRAQGLAADIAHLNKIVRDGNGAPSLMARAAASEGRIGGLQESMASLRADVTAGFEDIRARLEAQAAGRRNLWITTAGWIFGVLAAAVGAVLAR
jgi:gamma-glutamyl:cysteine ligase YbdK (ATP-grasp superfamily)